MSQKKKSNLAKTTLLASALTLGANIVANDITPGSWEAQAMSKNSEKKEEANKCGSNNCGKKDKKEKGKMANCGEGQCGKKMKKKSKKSDKGSEGSCGENTCGA